MIEVNPLKNKNQIDKMKKVLKSNPRDYCLFVLGINIGLRISDLLNLKISDVTDGEKIKKVITIKEIKTKKTKTFQINKNASNAINEYLTSLDDYSTEWYLFRSRKGDNKAISRVQAWQILNDAADFVGIKDRIGTHSLRKTFGYWAYKQGIDITLLQKIFNHSAPSVTLRYIGITQDEINDVYINSF